MGILSFLGLPILPFPVLDNVQSTVLDRPSCSQCSIKIEGAIALRPGGEDQGSFPDMPAAMRLDSRGRMYIAFQSPEILPMVFAPSGRFVQNLGRVGDGPGEYRRPTSLSILPGDSIGVIDVGSRRVSILSPGYRYIRDRRLPGKIHGTQILPDGQLIVNSELSSSEGMGLPLHRIAADGAIAQSFGVERAVLRPNDIYALKWHLVLGPDNEVVSVTEYYQYRVESWDPRGRRGLNLARKAEWFRPYTEVLNPAPDHPPSPSV